MKNMKVLSILALVALGTCLQNADLLAKKKTQDITKQNKRSSKNAAKALRENNKQDAQIAQAANGTIALQADVNDLKTLVNDPSSGIAVLAVEVAALQSQISSMPSADVVSGLQAQMQANADAITALQNSVAALQAMPVAIASPVVEVDSTPAPIAKASVQQTASF